MSAINADIEKMYEKTALPSGGFAIVALDQRDFSASDVLKCYQDFNL